MGKQWKLTSQRLTFNQNLGYTLSLLKKFKNKIH